MISFTRSHRIVAATAIVVLGLGACGDDADVEPSAQPTPEGTTFEEGDFDGIPLPPLAEPVGERSEEDEIVVQTFALRNGTPEDVMDFYSAQLSGSEVVAAPEQSGTSTLRAEWLLDDGRTLLVTTLPAPTAEGDEVEDAEVVTQFSLTLRPAGGSDHQDEE